MRFKSGILGAGLWCFTVSEKESADRIEIMGSAGRIRFATFATTPVELFIKGKQYNFPLPTPKHVQQPLIETVVNELLGKGKCPSTGESALRTAWVMDEILYDS